MRTTIAGCLALACALGAACAKKGDDRKAAERDRSAAPGEAAAGAAPAPAPARHHVLAEKVIAAIASGEFPKLAALTGKAAAAELGELTEQSFRKLRDRLAVEGIDLGKATISRVEVAGDRIELVDVFLAYSGKMFQLHFSAMESRGTYALLGIADWVRWI
jgi:hypothetical protein